MATEPGQVRHLIDRAMRIAASERTVTCVILPNDLQMEPAVATPPRAHGTVHSGPGFEQPRIIPAEDQLERAADVLNAGERVAMLVGAGALHATDEIVEVATRSVRGSPRRCSEGRGSGRSAVRDRIDRAAGHAPQLGADERTATRC